MPPRFKGRYVAVGVNGFPKNPAGVIEIQKLFIPAWFCMPREIQGKAVKRNIFKKNADDYNSPC